MKTLLLIDANSIIHRSFHAIPPFTAPDGRPTGALYGISAILLKLWREERPDYAAALFDRPEPTFRDKIYAEYKAQRPPAVDELVSQIIEARNLFNAFGIATFEKAGYEADDLIATFAEKFKKEKDVRVVILTGDRDTLQLVEGDRLVVKIFNKGVSDTTVYDEDGVVAKYGLRPNQLVDYKSFVGDASDNIKGVPGVGPKTATEILKEYGTAENFFKNAPEDSKLRQRLANFMNEAELAKKLVILERHVPIDMPKLGALEIGEPPLSVEDYFKAMNFNTLLARLTGKAPDEKPKTKLDKDPLKKALKEKSGPSQQPLF